MDHRIYKYPINLGMRQQALFLPKCGRILSVQMQHGECQLWAIVDKEAPRVGRRFEVLPTGAIVEDHDKLVFLGTVQVDGGSLIFHVFERLSAEEGK